MDGLLFGCRGHIRRRLSLTPTASRTFVVVAVSENVVGPLLDLQQELRWLYEVIKAPSQATGKLGRSSKCRVLCLHLPGVTDPPMVVVVHASFVEYTRRTPSRSDWPEQPWHPSGRRRVHLTCGRASGCRLLAICVDSGFTKAVLATQNLDRLGACREIRLSNPSTTPALLDPPPRWSLPKPLTTSLLKHGTPHSSHRSSPNTSAAYRQFLLFKPSPRHYLTGKITHVRSGYVRH